MIIGNIKDSSDLADKRALAMRLLQIEVENQEEIGKRFSAVESPYVPPEVPVQQKSLAQVEQDETELTNRLVSGLVKIGVKDVVARQAVNGFLTADVGTIQDIVNLIRSTPEIKKRFASLSPEDIDADHLIRIMGYVARDYQSTNGFAFDKNGKLASSYADIMKLLPEVKDVVKLMSILKAVRLTGFGETSYITRAIEDALQKAQYTEKIIKDINKVLPTLSERKISKGDEEKEEDKKSEINLAVEDFKKIILSGLTFDRNEVSKALMTLPPDGRIETIDELEEILADLLSKPFKQEDFIEASEDLKEYIMLPDYSNIKFAGIRRGTVLQPSVFEARDMNLERKVAEQMAELEVEEMEDNEELARILQADSNLYEQIFGEIMESISADSTEKAKQTVANIEDSMTGVGIAYESPILFLGSDKYITALNDLQKLIPKLTYENIDTIFGSEDSKALNDFGLVFGGISDIANLKRFIPRVRNELSFFGIESPYQFISNKLKIFKSFNTRASEVLENLRDKFKQIEKTFLSRRTILSKQRLAESKVVQRTMEEDLAFAEYIDALKKRNKNKQFKTSEIMKVVRGVDSLNEPNLYNPLSIEGRTNIKKDFTGRLITKTGRLQNAEIALPYNAYNEAERVYTFNPDYKPHLDPDTQFSKVIGLGAKKPPMNKSVFNPRRIKVGKGVPVEEEPKYSRFGRWVIHQKQLKDSDKLNLRYPSMAYIPNVRPTNVSPDYKDVLLDILESGKLNERKYERLSDAEKAHFTKVMEGSGLSTKFKFKGVGAVNTTGDEDRFKLLLGELKAGNNNAKMIAELKGLITKFIKEGRIDQKEGYGLLTEINRI